MVKSEQTAEQRFLHIAYSHRPALLAHCARMSGGDFGHAEDLVQETFARAWRQIDELRTDRTSVGRWLHRVAYNVAVDAHRMRLVRPTEVALLEEFDGSEPDQADEVLLSVMLEKMLNSIWPQHRAVVVEMFFNDRTMAQTAAVLQIPVGTVKSRLYYALRRLREISEEQEMRAS